MADGTIKQVNPFSGTEVWTVVGRGNRPLSRPVTHPQPLPADANLSTCAFCPGRKLDTPPEKARILSDGQIVHNISAGQLEETDAVFRRVPNLFEIVSYDYWHANYGYEMDADVRNRMEEYISTSAGREHVLNTMRTKRKAARLPADAPVDELLAGAKGFFASGHDVIIGPRHFVEGAVDDSQLASAGTLSADEHALMTLFTVDSMRELYQRNRYAPYVVVFQNWLTPAGASFDHLHKQLVAIDDRGMASHREVSMLRKHPNMYNEWAVDYAGSRNLIIAENEHAVMFAGFGHRYPTLEVFSTSPTCEPWMQTLAEVRAMSDLLHAAHAAVGPDVPSNEEWHHRPADVDVAMPWRVMIKLRTSNLAGFEGGTKIYLNTISPWDLRDKVVDKLYKLRDSGRISHNIRIATECAMDRNSLRYNPAL